MGKIGYRLPFVLMLVLGIFFVAQYYIPHSMVQQPASVMKQWKQPMGAMIMFVAAAGVIILHTKRVRRRQQRWGYSVVTLVSAAAMAIAGVGFGVQEGSLFAQWFKHLITPLESTMFSLLAFFIASAAFRAFRARTAGATILLVSAFIVILGLIPAVEAACPLLGDVAAFLLKYPNTAAKRAIMIGVALGAISVALKTIFGIDRTILGKGR
jgi:biopolymer transport protein ExbD